MIRPHHSQRAGSGFTMVELIVTITIIIILGVLSFKMIAMVREKSRWVVCVGGMRQIGSAMVARGMENNDIMYTRDEVGRSNFRAWKDPLSLCQVLKDYLPGTEVWMSPGANKRLRPYQNSYAWSLAPNVTEKRMNMIESPQNTLLLWNNYCYTVPSIHNVPEATSGPKPASRSFYAYPWRRAKAANWIYMDLHVETR